MNITSLTVTLATLAFAASVAGCAADRDTSASAVAPHNHWRDGKGMWVDPAKAGDPAHAGTAAPMGARGSSGYHADKAGAHAMHDMKAMCDMHKRMMAASTPEERAAMMDHMMKGMSDEEKKEHMKMMEQHCQ